MNRSPKGRPEKPIYVNTEQCHAYAPYAPRLVAANQSVDPFTLAHLPPRDQILSLLHLIAICDRLNWDFLLSSLATNLWELTDRFAVARLTGMTLAAFKAAFSGYRRTGENLGLRRRLRNLRSIATYIERVGAVERLLRIAKIAEPDGALSLLSELPVYRDDPLLKKGHTLLYQLVRRRLIAVTDEESIEPAVDYHVMRLYLRTSRVGVTDKGLIKRLVNREPIPLPVITDLRKTVAEALRYTAHIAGVPYLVLNEAEWAFARRSCEREEVSCYPEPICPLSHICPCAALPPVQMVTEPESRHGYY